MAKKAKTTVAKPTVKKVTASDRMSVLKDIDGIRVSKMFHGTMAVTVDFEADDVSITYVSTAGVTSAKVLSKPTLIEFGKAIETLVLSAHNKLKRDMDKLGSNKGFLIKVLTLGNVREPLGTNVQKSNKDVKIAKGLHKAMTDAAAAKLAHIADLEARLAELKG